MDQLAQRFEQDRPRLEALARRVLGSNAEAQDAVQEAWLRLARTDAAGVDNLGAWLSTVVGRICLDMLRSRTSRREDPLDETPLSPPQAVRDPEEEALLADSIGLALLVVLDTLAPAERLAFVLHDLFAVSFDEIAPIVGRTSAATRQLASRARRRVQAEPANPTELARGTRLVEAFLAAARNGEFESLLRMLDPDVDFRPDATAVAMGGPGRTRGAEMVAGFYNGRAQAARTAIVDGQPGATVEFGGVLRIALCFTVVGDRIVAIDVLADPEVLADLEILPA